MSTKPSTIIVVKNNYRNIPDNIYFANIVKMHRMKNKIYCQVDDKCPREVYRLLASSFDRVVMNNELSGTENIKLISSEYSRQIVRSSDHLRHHVDQTIDPFMLSSIYFRENNIMGMKRKEKKKKHRHIGKTYDLMELISRLYDVKPMIIHTNHLNTYHLNPSTQYHPYNLMPMFDSIDCYDYMEPIKRLSRDYEGDNYYRTILEEVEVDNESVNNPNMRLDEYVNIFPHNADMIMLEYVKCRPNIMIITIWKPAIKGVERFIEYLENYGNVYYVKQLVFSKKRLRNMMFWMYDDFNFNERNEYITNKLQMIDAQEINNEVCFIFFDNTKSMQLSGQGAPFKKELRNKMVEIMNFDPLKYTGDMMMHINDFFYQSVEYSQMILNENSLNALDHQDCERIMMYGKENLILQTFRNFIYRNLSLLELNRLMLINGSTTVQYGIRGIDHINAMMYADRNSASKRITRLIEKHFMEKKSKFYFADIEITESNKKMVQFFEAGNLQNMILNPKYYSYFQGIKVFTIDIMLYHMMSSNRVMDHIEMAMINHLNPGLINQWVEFDENANNRMYIKYLKKFEPMNKDVDIGDLYMNVNPSDIHTILDRYPYDRKLIGSSKLIGLIINLSRNQ